MFEFVHAFTQMRERLCLSVPTLSEQSGVPAPLIERLEGGDADAVSLSQAVSLAEALGLSLGVMPNARREEMFIALEEDGIVEPTRELSGLNRYRHLF